MNALSFLCPFRAGRTSFQRSVLCLVLASLAIGTSAATAAPNVIFIFVDDSGWGDFSCYGNPALDKQGQPITPNIDRLANEGMRFTQGYVVSPICSPSRVGLLTGVHPARHGIHSFLDDQAANANRKMDNWLQPHTITTAHLFKEAGYSTGLFGKWHMGGGRDVNDAPFPQDYGFETSLTSFEGMGDRLLVNGHGLSDQNADVPGTITWTEWYHLANLHTDAAIQFITAAHQANKPFFAYVPYDDTHSPYNVEPGHENDFDHITSDTEGKLFLAELNDLDRQIGRLIDAVDSLGIASNTLIVLVGDNGAPDDTLETLLNRNGGLRGGKGGLWEGGIREAFLARMPGTIPAGVVNTTPISTLDLLPTFCSLAGIALPPVPLEGENMKDVLMGTTRARRKNLFWEFGTVSGVGTSAPRLAIREGDLKFMRDPDGGSRQLYNLQTDRDETTNLVNNPAQAQAVVRMEAALMNWYRQVVLGEIGQPVIIRPGDPAGLIIADSFDVPGGNSAATGFGANTGVNQDLATRHTGALAGTLRYMRTDTAKPAAAHSIAANRFAIADAANTTAIQLSTDGVIAYDFGPRLRGRRYQWTVTMDHDDADVNAARMTLGIADSATPAGGVGGHALGVQLDLVAGNTISVFKRIDGASNAGGTDINTAIRTGLPAGAPVEIRVVLQDSTDYSVFGTAYAVFVNGASADSGNIRFTNDSRYLIFDTAQNTGPAQYDNFSVETLEAAPDITGYLPMLGIAQATPAAVSGISRFRLFWSTQPDRVCRPVISADLQNWQPLPGQVLVDSLHHTLQWFDAEIPIAYQQPKCFIRLELVE